MSDMKKHELSIAFQAAFPHTVPVLTGFIVLGMAYGVLMQTKGYETIWAVTMSAVAFCGSMQFVSITLLTVAFDPIAAFIMSIMVNARHLFYGIAMLDKYKGLGKVRGLLIYTLCDETFSMSASLVVPQHVEKKYFYGMISCLNYMYWVIGTFMGGILGTLITFNTKGLDFVLTGLFVVLFMEQVKHKENRISALIGVIASIVSIILFGAENMVIPAMILILVTLIVRRKQVCH